MADPSRSRRPTVEGPGQSTYASQAPERNKEGNSKSTAATFGSAPRGARSSRTPAISKDGEPHRSPTAPVVSTVTDSRMRKGAPSSTTLPPPNTGQRSLTDATKPTTSRAPVAYNTRNPLAGTDYRVEPLEQKDSPWLAPPGSGSDYRQSGSSFQTEPSSYYSADDDAPKSSPPPPMPIPQPAQPPRGNRYEELWRAAQGPPMPIPSNTPSVPSPQYDREELTSFYAESSDADNDDGSPDIRPSHDEPHEPRDLYDSSWLAAPSPGIPVPETAAPSMPMPQTSGGTPNLNSQSSYRRGEANTGPNIPSTAPLRIHHQYRPTSTSTSTPSPSPSAQTTRPPAMPQPKTNAANDAATQKPGSPQNSSNLGSQSRPADARPSAEHINSNVASPAVPMPQAARPTATHTRPTASASINGQRPTPTLQNSSRLESGGPPTSRPTIPTPSPSAAPNHSSIYAQFAMPRVDTNAQANGPARPQNPATAPASSPSSTQPTSRLESRPSANSPRPTAFSTSQKPAAPLPQPAPSRTETNQGGRPSGAGPSAFSTSVSPRPTSTQAQYQPTQAARPHVAETSRPQQVSAPPPPPPQPAASANTKLQQKEDVAAHAAANLASGPTRPRLHGNLSQMDTQYVNMMLALDDIPALHNIAASFFAWILLAGFILFPGTFTSLQNIGPQTGTLGQELIGRVTQLPLFIVAWVCTGIGVFGLLWLWWRWRKNYLFALNKIFLPGLMNSLAGLLSTLASIFGAQHGQFSTTSKSTLIVTGASTAVFAILTAFYALWLVRRVKARHDREVGKQTAGKHGEGAVDVSTRRL